MLEHVVVNNLHGLSDSKSTNTNWRTIHDSKSAIRHASNMDSTQSTIVSSVIGLNFIKHFKQFYGPEFCAHIPEL